MILLHLYRAIDAELEDETSTIFNYIKNTIKLAIEIFLTNLDQEELKIHPLLVPKKFQIFEKFFSQQ